MDIDNRAFIKRLVECERIKITTVSHKFDEFRIYTYMLQNES